VFAGEYVVRRVYDYPDDRRQLPTAPLSERR
jgi:hypothetical protein